jgi:hypothetical protein
MPDQNDAVIEDTPITLEVLDTDSHFVMHGEDSEGRVWIRSDPEVANPYYECASPPHQRVYERSITWTF